MTLRSRIAHVLFGDLITAEVKQATAAITVRVDDSPGYQALNQGPQDRPWADRQQDLEDTLEAWRKNFQIRRLVALTRSYVVGAGITLTSQIPEVDTFIRDFWTHPQNRMDQRLGPWCDELTRTGELFPVLFTNRQTGMSYVRAVPATQIRNIATDPDDIERELSYTQQTTHADHTWIGIAHPKALTRSRGGPGGHLAPLMLHIAVNRPVGAIRGSGDLLPVLPWARRYSEWLADRVRLNRQRTRQGLMDLTITDDTMVEAKRQQLRTANPVEAGIYVHGPGEEVKYHNLEIKADEVADDGLALRLAVATGANVALHYMGEGEGTNYATAKEMGEPTARFYTERQNALVAGIADLLAWAYRRSSAAINLPGTGTPDDLQIIATTPEVARADNQALAQAARNMASALETLSKHGWIDDPSAVRLALKFAGEPTRQADIDTILANAPKEDPIA